MLTFRVSDTPVIKSRADRLLVYERTFTIDFFENSLKNVRLETVLPIVNS